MDQGMATSPNIISGLMFPISQGFRAFSAFVAAKYNEVYQGAIIGVRIDTEGNCYITKAKDNSGSLTSCSFEIQENAFMPYILFKDSNGTSINVQGGDWVFMGVY